MMDLKITLLICSILLLSCTNNRRSDVASMEGNTSLINNQVSWEEIESINIEELNKDIVPGKLTVDLGVYYPSNLDPEFDKVPLENVIESIKAAKEIYAPTGIQINLLWIKTGEISPRFLSLQSNVVPGIPNTEYTNTYEHMYRHPSTLTKETKEAFESIIEPNPDNSRTIYLAIIQDVFYPFIEVSEGRNWVVKSVRTGGLSFPPYIYHSNIPKNLRGIITISNLQREDRLRGTIAHEIGHKVINVSHEYKETDPGHEVYQDGGLMLYGDGEDIPSGVEGRWHLERLKLSPFLYVLEENGNKRWNPEFKEGGHYYDPIYGDKVIHFESTPPIDSDW
ncbi:MAG: hypothetical protein ABJH08_02295 [Balneola sp.]